jgi:hypothetical protein
MKKIMTIVIAVLIGCLTLVGYFIQASMAPVLAMLFDWALLLFGVAGLLGIIKLLANHLRKLIKQEKNSFLSLVVIVAFVIVFILLLVFSPQNSILRDVILTIQRPVEAGLLAVLAVTLAFNAIRLIRIRGWSPLSISFVVGALVFLLLDIGLLPLQSDGLVGYVVDFFRLLPVAGARGIILGMALGALVVSLRFLLAADRPLGD